MPLEPLNARMNEGRGNDIEFTKAPEISVQITRTRGGAQVKGAVTTACRQPCSLCSLNLEVPIEVTLDYILKPAPVGTTAEEAKAMADSGVMYYQDEQFDLEDLVQEALILSLSPYYYPECGNDGKCLRCGEVPQTRKEVIKREEKNSLGALMANAKKRQGGE
jgi:uncharacterized metal-binding protein YceD (DUF177 family)